MSEIVSLIHKDDYYNALARRPITLDNDYFRATIEETSLKTNKKQKTW